MRRSFALLLLAYLVPTFLLGYVWHLVLFHEYYVQLAIYRSDVIVPFGFLSMLLQAALLAWVYPRLVERPELLASGLRFAAGAALLSWTFTTLAVAAKHPISSISGFVAIETAFTLVQFGLVGLLLPLSVRAGRSVAQPSAVSTA